MALFSQTMIERGVGVLGNKYKTIGVFVSRASDEYQEKVCRAISHRAYELGYNTAIFSNFVGHGDPSYEQAESNIANIVKYEDLAGIIMFPDVMFVKDFIPKIINNIKNCKTDCPVICIRQPMEGFQNILVKDENILEEIIRHFIVHHKFTKLNFLTGPPENPASIHRLNTYKRVLTEYGIPIDEDRIRFGDFWKRAAYDVVEEWLAMPGKFPEAIICANDIMAVTVCDALAAHGIMVPRDVAVSGCDNIDTAIDYSPSITTVGMPLEEMGREAVDRIHLYNLGTPKKEDSYLKFVTHIRESCGCTVKMDLEETYRRRNYILKELDDREYSIYETSYMSIDLTGVTSLEELDGKLGSYSYINKGFRSFYMCLYKDWDKFKSEEEYGIPFNEREVIMEVGIKRGEWLPKVTFEARNLLPAEYMDAEPQSFYFNMLHHRGNCYGYTAINFENFQAYKSSYQGWLTNVCNALENIKIHNELNMLVFKLEDMSIKDELTGLYNRRALHTLGQRYLEQSIEGNSNIMIFSADMDNLKYINDVYGHAGGDIAIKVVADALLNAAEDDEICIRMGGDEFSVIGIDYDNEKIVRFVEKFTNGIQIFNQNSKYDFKVSVSYGWSITKADKYTTLEECLSVADKKMYLQKYEKRRRG